MYVMLLLYVCTSNVIIQCSDEYKWMYVPEAVNTKGIIYIVLLVIYTLCIMEFSPVISLYVYIGND